MKVITAPEEYERQPNDIFCFLAGGITGCGNWQAAVISYLDTHYSSYTTSNLVIFNPRRENFPIDDTEAASKQIEWEFKYLNQMDIFSMYFVGSDSLQPICMYELGRYLEVMKRRFPDDFIDRIWISVEPGYKREIDVKIQTSLALCNTTDLTNLTKAVKVFSPFSGTRHHAEGILRNYILMRR